MRDPDYDDYVFAWENAEPQLHGGARTPQCITCGMWCRWHEHPQGWRLTMPDGSVHICGAVADVDEFEVVNGQ